MVLPEFAWGVAESIYCTMDRSRLFAPELDCFIIIVNYYTAGVQYASTTYREVTGLFKVGKYRPLIAAIINLAVSIILAYPLGISGILLGTIISRLCVYFWYDPYIIHKTLFRRKLKHYFATYILYGMSTLGAGCFALRLAIIFYSESGACLFGGYNSVRSTPERTLPLPI